MLKYSREIKKFGPKADLKSLENAIQIKGLDFINSMLKFPTESKTGTEPEYRNLPLESRNLLLTKIINSKYLNRDLVKKTGLDKLELFCGDKMTLDRLDFVQFKGKPNMLVHALDGRAPEFTKALSAKTMVNPFLLLESKIKNNQFVDNFDLNGTEFNIDYNEIENKTKDDFDAYSLSKFEIYNLLQSQSAERGELQTVEKYHHILKKIPKFQLESYTNLIKCYSKRQLHGGAEETYRIVKNGNLPTSSAMFQHMIHASSMAKAVNYFHEPKYKSVGMYTALINAYFKNKEPLLAYKCVKRAIKDGRRNKQSGNVHIPADIAKLILADLKGKHIDYFRDMMKLADLGTMLAPLISKLIAETTDPALGKQLYDEFITGSCQEFNVPITAHLGALKHVGSSDAAAARSIFDRFIDVSLTKESDFYNELLGIYSKHEMKPQVHDLYAEMKKNGLKPNLKTFESLLRVKVSVTEELYEKMIVPTKQYPLIFEAMKKELVSPLLLQ